MNTFDLHRFELTDTSGQAWQVEACSTRPSDWDAWMLQVDTTNYLQAGVCAEFEQRLRCGQPVYITLHNAGNIAGRLLLFREPTAAGFFLGSAFRRRTLLPAMHHLPGKLHWLEGPVLNNALPVQEALRLFLQAVDKLVRPLNAVEVSHATLPRGIGQEETQELEQGMSDFGYASQPWVSYIIHLDQPEEILWKNLKQDVRNKIRKAIKKDLTFVEVTDREGLAHYYRTFLEHRRRNQLGVTFSLDHLWDLFEQTREGIRYFLVMDGEHPVAGQGGYLFNHTLHRVMSAVSNYALENKVYGGEFLQWEILRWARNQGLRWYDFAGAAYDPSSDKEANIRAFKSKFGGEEIIYNLFQKTCPGIPMATRRRTARLFSAGSKTLTRIYDSGIYEESAPNGIT